MPIARSGTAQTGNSASNASLTLSLSSFSTGDLMFLWSAASGTTPAAPAGWTSLTNGQITVGFRLSWRRKEAGDTQVVLAAINGSTQTAQVTAYSGAGTPTVGSNVTLATAATSTDPNAITPVRAGSAVITFVGAGGSGLTYTAPANYTKNVNSTGAPSMASGERWNLPASSENPAAWTHGSSTNRFAVTCAIPGAQFMRPDADVNDGFPWLIYPSGTQGDLYAQIDEFNPLDSDLIGSEAIASSTTTTVILSLNTITNPGTSTGWTFRVRSSKSNNNRTFTLRMKLYDGATEIGSARTVAAVTTTAAAYTAVVSSGDIDTLRASSDPRVGFEFVASGGSLGTTGGNIFWFEIEAPEAPADTTPPVTDLTLGENRISAVSGQDSVTFSATANEACQAWQLRLVPGTSSPQTAGTLIESGGAVASGGTISGSITHSELVAAGGTESTLIVKMFLQDLAGNWST